MEIQIPNLELNYSGFCFLSKLNEKLSAMEFEEVILDFSNTGWIDANMLPPLVAIIQNARENLTSFKQRTDTKSDVRKLLEKNGFFPNNNNDKSDEITKLSVFKPNETSSFITKAEEFIEHHNFPKNSNTNILRALSEIFTNTYIHSKTQKTTVCGQYCLTKKQISFTISDYGVGILQVVKNKVNSINTNIDAIEWALQKGTTTKTGNIPGGKGLKDIDNFIFENKGKLIIVSGNGYLEKENNNELLKELDYNICGTTVSIVVNTT